jgi:radical SAM protein with 4Fe4S-binding SPASM domain
MKIYSAFIEITNVCNLNCKTCYNHSGTDAKRQEISFIQLQDAISKLIELGARQFILAGGEPTLHSQFEQILELINLFPNYLFSISTNGTVHNQKLIDIYNTVNNFDIQVSLDGSCEEVNSSTRGKDNFLRALEFIQKLEPTKKKLRVKMVISKNNLFDVESFYRKVVSLGGVPEFAFINRQGNAINNWDGMCISGEDKFDVIKLVSRLNTELEIKALLPLCTNRCPLSNESKNLSVTIKVDGTIMPCQLLYDNYFALGNIFNFNKTDFENKLNFVSNLVKTRENTDYGCNRCIIRSQCKKGCMALAFNITGNPLSCDGECDFRKLQYIKFDFKERAKGLMKSAGD